MRRLAARGVRHLESAWQAGWDLRREATGETPRFLLLSILIGVLAGLLVVCFHISIELLSWSTVRAQGPDAWLRILIWPPLGAGVAYALVTFYFRAARGSGVNNTKAALYVSDGYVPARSIPGKFLACVLSIGSGNPMGPEDPALQMGAGIASLLGRLFRLTRRNMRMIAPTGAAAGIAAAFNTPVTGVLFVMEEVVASWRAAVMGSIVLSAVSAVVVVRWFLGDASLLQVPPFRLTHPTELIIYGVTGLVGGLASAWFTRFVTRFRQRLLRLRPVVRHTLPIGAGLVVGAVGLWAPEVLGTGYSVIESALHDGFVWHVLLVLAVLKIATTSVSFCAGTPGGMFAPTLFVGAMLGGGLGGLAHLLWPMPTSPASAYVLVGIGTFFAGVFRAPMTSIFMVFEVSGTYEIILPVMISNTIAYLLSRRLQPESLFQIVGQQDGLDLPSVEHEREAPVLSVEDAMSATHLDQVLGGELSVDEALARMGSGGLETCLFTMGWGNWQVTSRSELETAARAGSGVRSLARAEVGRQATRIYPDVSLDSAMRLLAAEPVLVVCSRADQRRLLGTLTLDDVLVAYGLPPGSEGEASSAETD
jgi:CIC family chloride channel protein